tara:strand:+ start:466 stop:732 length:267 start_codon:yes stop_codon:yes gene_type:complete
MALPLVPILYTLAGLMLVGGSSYVTSNQYADPYDADGDGDVDSDDANLIEQFADAESSGNTTLGAISSGFTSVQWIAIALIIMQFTKK